MRNNTCGNLFQRYLTETSGVFALKLALVIAPVLIAVGMAIDVSRLTAEKQALQDATDSAVLNAAKAFEVMMSDPNKGETFYRTAAESVFYENIDLKPSLAVGKPNVYLGKVDTVVVEATARVKPHFMQIFGYPKLSVSAESHAAIPQNQVVEVALIADHSGSLATNGGGNFVALGDALDVFVDEISPENDMGNLYVSFIPWSGTVNVGRHRTSWINTYHKNDFGKGEWGGCVRARWDGLDVTDTPPSTGKKFDVFAWPSDQHNDWKGLSAENYVSISPYPDQKSLRGPNQSCDNELLSLTNNKAELATKVTEYKTTINQKIGTLSPWAMVWGWRTLSPRWKGLWGGSTPSYLPDAGSKKIAIFLSDGIVNWDRRTNLGYYSPYGYVSEDFLGVVANGLENSTANRNAEMVNRFWDVCDTMKSEGIEIITIGYVVNDDGADTMRACATSPSHYYHAPDRATIKKVFSDIAAKMRKAEVRLVR